LGIECPLQHGEDRAILPVLQRTLDAQAALEEE
jgi:hypothetical protein